VVHPSKQGGPGQADYTVLARFIRDDLVLVTENARDFRALASRSDIHPGMIILLCVDRCTAKALLPLALLVTFLNGVYKILI
jgi:predicted nuclease of predicted toxin-antitoxin system